MKRIMVVFLLTLNISTVSISKNTNEKWIISKTFNSIGIDVENDLFFNIISFLPERKVEIFLKNVINNEESIVCNYDISDFELMLKTNTPYKFKIKVKNDRMLVLSRNENIYYFRKLVKIDDKNIIMMDTNYVKNDTVNIIKYLKPIYNGDLYNLIRKYMPKQLRSDSSSLYSFSFNLLNTGEINDLKVNPDLVQKEILDEIIRSSSTKWKPARINGEKSDSKIEFLVYVESTDEFHNEILNPTKTMNIFFEKGNNAYMKGDVSSSLINFYNCEQLFDSYSTFQNYKQEKDADFYKNQELWISSIMNQASIYFYEQKSDKACQKWRKILLIDKVAYVNFKNECIK